MTEYATKKDVAKVFKKSQRTIQRWIEAKKEIRFDGRKFHPEKDPGGCWRFVVKLL